MSADGGGEQRPPTTIDGVLLDRLIWWAPPDPPLDASGPEEFEPILDEGVLLGRIKLVNRRLPEVFVLDLRHYELLHHVVLKGLRTIG